MLVQQGAVGFAALLIDAVRMHHQVGSGLLGQQHPLQRLCDHCFRYGVEHVQAHNELLVIS